MTLFAQTMTIVCAVGAGTVAGAFFTFSTFTMNGLKRLAPEQGAAAMQAINKEAPTPLFMLLQQLPGRRLSHVHARVYINGL